MIGRFLSIYAFVAAAAFSQGQGALQQRVEEVKQSIAQNQAQLRQYTWTETTEINLKGEEKKRTQAACQYGPDGKVQKTAIGAAPPPPSSRGIRGRIVTKKIDEMKAYMDRVSSLMQRYIPPNAQDMQAQFQAGHATLNPGSGELVFSGYVKTGDRVILAFDRATKKLRSFSVATYLDNTDDVVTMEATFSSLSDGTNFVEQSVLDATAKQIEVTTTNFGYRKLGG